jgi:hypothetical protein
MLSTATILLCDDCNGLKSSRLLCGGDDKSDLIETILALQLEEQQQQGTAHISIPSIPCILGMSMAQFGDSLGGVRSPLSFVWRR